MVFSEIVAYFIILATGATLFVSGKTDIQSATDAAQALRSRGGRCVCRAARHRTHRSGRPGRPGPDGIGRVRRGRRLRLEGQPRFRTLRAPQFYAVIVAATLVGIAINFLGINPIKALVVSAVINGLLAAPILILVMLVSNNRKVMGERTNGRLLNAVGWATTLVMGVAAIALIVTTVFG